VIEVLSAGDNANFHPQVINGNIATVNLWKADRVFFGGENGARAALKTAVDHIDNFLLRVAVVIRVALGVNDIRSQTTESVFEAFGDGDAGNGGDLKA